MLDFSEDEDSEQLSEFTEERYEIGEILGRGANGTVYLAFDRELNRKVAIKRLNSLIADRHAEERFRFELETIAGLEHPHVIPILDHGEMEGRAFYAMRYVEGGTLADGLKVDREPREIVNLMLQIISAVAHGHARGILHRDLKPENILLENGDYVFVSDFGLAKRFSGEGDRELSLTGEVFGTPAYMAPEQALGDRSKVTTASDVFALGAILFRLLAGHRAFDGQDSHLVLQQVIEREVSFTAKERKRIGSDLATICLKCLQKEPSRRYSTASEFGDDLQRYLDGKPVTARPIPAWARVARWAKRNPSQSVLITVCVALLLGFGVFVFHSGNQLMRERDEAQNERQEARRQLYYASLSLISEDVKNFAFLGLNDRLDDLASYEDTGFELDYWKSKVISPRRSLPRAEGGALSLDIGPLGDRYLAGGNSHFVRVYDLEGEVLGEFEHSGFVFNAFFLGDGEVVASASWGNDLVLWRVADGHKLPVPAGKFCAMGKIPGEPSQILGLTSEGELIFWEWETGRVLSRKSLDMKLPLWCHLAIYEGGKSAVFMKGLWDLKSGRSELFGNDVYWDDRAMVKLSPSGKEVMHQGNLIDMATGSSIFGLGNPNWRMQSAFLKDGTIATTTAYRGLAVWSPGDRGRQHPKWLRNGVNEMVSSVAVAPNGEWLLSGTMKGEIDLWYLEDFEGSKFDYTEGGRNLKMGGVGYSSDGERLITSSADGVVNIWDIESGERELSKFCHEGGACNALFINEDREVFSAGNDGRAMIWNASTGAVIHEFAGGGLEIWAMAVSAEHSLVGTVYLDGDAVVRDAGSGEIVQRFKGAGKEPCAAAFSPDGKFFMTGGHSGTAIVWSVETGAAVSEFLGHDDWISDAMFTKDGKGVLTTSADRTTRLWDAQSGAELMVFEGHDNKVNAVAVSQKGNRVFTVSDDATARVWDAETGRPLLVIPGANGAMAYLALSPNGTQLAISADGVANIVDTE